MTLRPRRLLTHIGELMSRRSLRPPGPEYEAAFSASRMAPGGRRWSESPVPRVAARNIRRMGTTPPDPVAPTFVDRDQWIPYLPEDVTFEMHDGADPYSPPFGTFDRALAWAFCRTTTFTPPTGWTTIASGTLNGLNYWVGWVANASASTDWTLTFSAEPGYPEGYRNTHVVVEYYSGGNLHPVATTPLHYSSVSSAAFGQPDPAWFLRRQVSFIRYEVQTYYKYHTYNATLIGSSATKDLYFLQNEVYAGSMTFFSDSGRTVPTTVTNVVSMGLGWVQ